MKQSWCQNLYLRWGAWFKWISRMIFKPVSSSDQCYWWKPCQCRFCTWSNSSLGIRQKLLPWPCRKIWRKKGWIAFFFCVKENVRAGVNPQKTNVRDEKHKQKKLEYNQSMKAWIYRKRGLSCCRTVQYKPDLHREKKQLILVVTGLHAHPYDLHPGQGNISN